MCKAGFSSAYAKASCLERMPKAHVCDSRSNGLSMDGSRAHVMWGTCARSPRLEPSARRMFLLFLCQHVVMVVPSPTNISSTPLTWFVDTHFFVHMFTYIYTHIYISTYIYIYIYPLTEHAPCIYTRDSFPVPYTQHRQQRACTKRRKRQPESQKCCTSTEYSYDTHVRTRCRHARVIRGE